jgi:hypothetical protein
MPGRCLGLFVLVAVSASAALAADGVLEINHTCATTSGCFAGDTQGYPVQITQPGSYRLTSNLSVPASTNGVDLDLGGFEIAGPVSCLAGCPAPGSGSGVVSALFGGNQCGISNGKVRGFAEDGVRLDSGSGPPTDLNFGWVRTGNDGASSGSFPPGVVNCSNWGTPNVGSVGSAVALRQDWTQPGDAISPWEAQATDCGSLIRTWCVQD